MEPFVTKRFQQNKRSFQQAEQLEKVEIINNQFQAEIQWNSWWQKRLWKELVKQTGHDEGWFN